MNQKTLAQFVQQTREELGLNAKGLAKKCNLDLALIERIEAGEELFLPTTVRQNLAKGLKCSLDDLKELEKEFDSNFISEVVILNLKEQILGGEKGLICPRCRSILITKIEKMYDLEDNLVLHPKARCAKCVFQIK